MNREVLRRWCYGFLIASALCGHIAFLFVQAEVGIYRPELGPTAGWILAALTIALPHLTVCLAEQLYNSNRLSAQRVRWIFACEWLPALLASPESPSMFLLATVMMLLGHALPRLRNNAFAAWSLAATLTLTLTAASTVPSIHWLWFLPLSVIVVGAAVVLLHARDGLGDRDKAPGWTLRTAPQALTPGPTPARLALFALPFVLLALFAIPIFSFGIMALPVPLSGARREGSERQHQWQSQPPTTPAGAAARAAFQGVFPSNISYGRNVAPLQHETVMIVSAPPGMDSEQVRAQAPFYLRGLVQDRFSQNGTVFGGGDSMRELFAQPDGWVSLSESRPEPSLQLEIHQQPLLTRHGNWNILFSTQPACAIRAEQVKFDPDGVLVSLTGNSEWKRYSVRSGVDDARRWKLGGVRASHPDSRYLQLPQASRALDEIRSAAVRITRDALDDAGRVEAIVDHFTRHFAYTLNASDTPGLEGVVEFLARRRGHCTSFAAGSALLLRTLGIPARVATGFLVDDWSDSAGGFEVTTRNGHAWLEVHYEEFGWLRYEPTPSERRMRALRATEEFRETSLTAWLSDLASDLSYWASSGADESDLRLAAQTLADGPRALLVSVRRAPWTFLCCLVGLSFAWYILARLAVRRVSRADSRDKSGGRVWNEYELLLRALAARGHRKPTRETPREFARRIALDRAPWSAIVPVTEMFYRARYGGESLTLEERNRFKVLTEAVLRA